MMLFKLDENLPTELVAMLQVAGHEAMTVGEQGLSGAPDESVADHCRKEGRAIVTLDMDFADIRRYPPDHYGGIIVLRLSNQAKPAIVQAFAQVLALLPVELLPGRLWIADEARVRIRSAD